MYSTPCIKVCVKEHMAVCSTPCIKVSVTEYMAVCSTPCIKVCVTEYMAVCSTPCIKVCDEETGNEQCTVHHVSRCVFKRQVMNSVQYTMIQGMC